MLTVQQSLKFIDFLKNVFSEMLIFLRLMLVLEGLKRSGRPVGRISSYFHGLRGADYDEKNKKITTKEVTTTLM